MTASVTAYLFILTSTVLFSVQFAFTKKYQTMAGTGMGAAFFFNAVSPLVFALLLLLLDGCKWEITSFSVLMSFLWAVISNAITYFSIKALSLGSVSNYSLFLLGGGMILPAIYGAVWGKDAFGAYKVIGIFLILSAVCIKINRKEKADKTAFLCFFVLFVLNGLISILASIYQSDLPFFKPSETQFAIQRAFMTVVVGALAFSFLNVRKVRTIRTVRDVQAVQKVRSTQTICPVQIPKQARTAQIVRKKTEKDKEICGKQYIKAAPWAVAGGLANGAANLLLLYSLLTLEPSLQYPIVTGGSILLSTVIGIYFKEKPDLRTWISVGLALLGTIVMVKN